MNRYTIEHEGRRFVVEADNEEQALGLVQGGPPVDQLVAGTPQQMAQQRASNVQARLGLDAPVAPGGQGVGMWNRIKMGLAPTAPERQAAAEATYGKDSFLPISSTRALIKVPDGQNGFKYVLDNPAGFDMGDVAEMATNAPQIIAGAIAGASAIPGPTGATAKLAAASGASAIASNVVGAAQDAAYRAFTGTPIRPGEIAERRGLGTALEFLGGFAAGKGGSYVAEKLGASRAASNAVKQFIKEGDEASVRLKGAGIKPPTVAELGDAVRASNPVNMTAADAGEQVAKVLSDLDQRILGASSKMAGAAGTQAEKQAMAAIAGATQAKPITAPEAGRAAIGAAKQKIFDAQKSIDQLYDSAYKQIAEDSAKTGSGKFIVELGKTRAVIDDMMGKLPRNGEGEVASAFLPMRQQIAALSEMTDATQKLEAMRATRTMIGERLKGKGGIFGDMQESVAKRLYASLSQDIDDSVAAVSGKGGETLKMANAAYKAMLQPVEQSKFLDDLVNDGFRNPEDVVDFLTKGGTSDWAAAKSMLPAPVFAGVRRSVVDSLMGSSKVNIAGRELADIGTLNRKLSKLDAEVKNDLFGGSAPWQAIEQAGREIDFLASKNGVFTSQALPTMNELRELESVAKTQGVDSANRFIRGAIEASKARRNNLSQSLVSQINKGNYRHVADRPEDFFDSFILSGRHGPEYVSTVIRRLPDDVREDVAKAGFQRLFEKVRDTSQSVVSGNKGKYDTDQMLRNVLGSYRQQQVVEKVIGRERMGLIKDWARVELATQIKNSKASVQGKRVAGLLATAPYPNLFAARAASLALEKAAGREFISKAGPDAVEVFHQARMASRYPTETATGIAVLQNALNHPQYGNYQAMMQDFSPEQQDAIDQYLLGR